MGLDAADEGGALRDEGGDGLVEGGGGGGDVILGAEEAEDIHHAHLPGEGPALRRGPDAEERVAASLQLGERLSHGGARRERSQRRLPDAEVRHLMRLQEAHCHALAGNPRNGSRAKP